MCPICTWANATNRSALNARGCTVPIVHPDCLARCPSWVAKSSAKTPPQSGLVRQWVGGKPGDPWRSKKRSAQQASPGQGQPRLHRERRGCAHRPRPVLRSPFPGWPSFSFLRARQRERGRDPAVRIPSTRTRDTTNTFLDRHACLVAVGRWRAVPSWAHWRLSWLSVAVLASRCLGSR